MHPGTVSMTQRGLQKATGNHKAICLSPRALQRSFIPGQLAQEAQQLEVCPLKAGLSVNHGAPQPALSRLAALL